MQDVYDPPEQLNIADLFLEERIHAGHGDRVAIVDDDGEWTYAQVRQIAHDFSRVLLRLGVCQEQRVIVALPDSVAFAGAIFGVLKIGGVVVMVNPAFAREQVAALLDYVRPTVAVIHSSVLAAYEAALGDAENPAELLVVGGPGDHGHEDESEGEEWPVFEEERELDPEGFLEIPGGLPTTPTHRDDPAIWLFSGGTTGRPKAVVQTHRSFAYTTECYGRRVLGYNENDTTLSVPKLFFGYATGSNLFFPFSVGGKAILFAEKPTADVLFEKIARHRPTILINVPTLINRMVAHADAASQDLSCLRFATSAGEALPVPLYHRWRELFEVDLLDGLGTAEMWHVFVTNRPGDVKPGTLGRVVEGFEICVRDDEGRDLPDGEVGRLWVRGGARAICYWQNMDKTQDAFRGEWFVGGDLVCRDANGYLTYCGRGDDVLKVAGKWLVPSEVESCLLEHADVRECAVVGVTDDDGLMKPYAFVLADEGTDAEALAGDVKRFSLERLEPYKHPRRVIVLEAFPRTHLGKVDRGQLKTMV